MPSRSLVHRLSRECRVDLDGDERAIVVCSYQFAVRKADELATCCWDLAVLDEAHRLRNVYKPGAKTATAIRTALASPPKVLLPATPLQNSLIRVSDIVLEFGPR